jgi:diguanylate cyclase (GGDEF)-like protein/PAS domain S-box-containing protein
MSDKKQSLFRRFNHRQTQSPATSAFRIALTYVVFGVLWILISDHVLALLVGTGQIYHDLQTVKGWFYVLITALILYFLIIETLGLYQESKNTLKETNEKLSEQLARTQLSEERYHLAVLGSTDSMWEYDHTTRRLFTDDRLLKSLGYSDEDAQVSTIEDWLKFVVTDQVQAVQESLANYFADPVPVVEITYPIYAHDGTIAWIHTRGYAQIDHGSIRKIGGSHTNITLQRHYEHSLFDMAYRDALTGLPNWNRFEQLFNERVAEDPEAQLILAYVDIDDFKNINDVYGFKNGDQLLIQIGEDLNLSLGHDRLVAKLGGDSFGILCRLDQIPNPIDVETSLLSVIHRTRLINNNPITVTASVGIVVYPRDGRSFLELMQLADETMYDSKRRGKNKVSFHDPITHQDRLDTLTILNQLRQSVVTGDFSLVFQPVIRMSNHQTTSIETLVRWQDTQGRSVSPARFIPLAEKHGLILGIERWIFRKAFAQLRLWLDEGMTLPISINLSGVGLSDAGFIDEILQMAKDLEIPQSAFRIEITETALIENHDAAMQHLEQFRKDGVKILLDDFGSGYSSLTYLTQLPMDVIKIDARFVRQLSESPKNQKILRSVVSLGHDLECKIIAEGVETEEEASMLHDIGIRYGQGYLYAYPMDAQALKAFLSSARTSDPSSTSHEPHRTV